MTLKLGFFLKDLSTLTTRMDLWLAAFPIAALNVKRPDLLFVVGKTALFALKALRILVCLHVQPTRAERQKAASAIFTNVRLFARMTHQVTLQDVFGDGPTANFAICQLVVFVIFHMKVQHLLIAKTQLTQRAGKLLHLIDTCVIVVALHVGVKALQRLKYRVQAVGTLKYGRVHFANVLGHLEFSAARERALAAVLLFCRQALDHRRLVIFLVVQVLTTRIHHLWTVGAPKFT